MKAIISIIAFCLITIIPSFAQESSFDTTGVIVRFNFKLINWDLVDDTKTLTCSVKDILNQDALSELNTMSFEGFNLEEIQAYKIFPMLQTEDSISISRHGAEVVVPPFWATFKLIKPESVKYHDFISELQDRYPLIIYAHPNHLIDFTTPPNDTLYGQQSSLHDTGNGYAHINIDSAWLVNTGEEFIKVGVFDSGIDTSHLDLEVLTGMAGHNNVDLYNGTLQRQWGTDYNNHGTKTAGLIGAKRNNTTGIAGIAGGNDSTSTGVNILDFKMDYNNNPGHFASIEGFSALIMDASRSTGTYFNWLDELQPDHLEYEYSNAPGYGINIGNHSTRYRLANPFKNDEDPDGGGVGGDFYQTCNLCVEAYLFSLKNGVITITASGNKVNEIGITPATFDGSNTYPASFHDSWSIRVGASQEDGDVLMGGINTSASWFSIWSDNVDLIAPGHRNIVETTHSLNNPEDPSDTIPYGHYNGTSAAAPHVSGVTALLLSHYNKPCYSNINLDMADVEYILQKSATPSTENINSGGHHNGAGWGLLNATAAMNMIDFPEYQIIHPIDTFIDRQTISIDTIHIYYKRPINEGSTGPISAQWPLEILRPYKVVRYEEQLTYDFSQYIQDSSQLLDAWVRHSQTNSLTQFIDTTHEVNFVFGNYDTTIIADHFRVEPMAKIDTIINDSLIKMTGYYYHFILKYDDVELQEMNYSLQFPENYWYPVNPDSILPRMAYSIYVRDTVLDERYDFECDSLNPLLDSVAKLYNTDLEKDFQIYPNPASSRLNVRLLNNQTSGLIQLTDLSGRLINEISISNKEIYTLDISSLKNGFYFVNLITEGTSASSQTWIKL